MSLDRSLKSASGLVRHRNVLTRAERLVRLKNEERWDENKPVLGLPKVGNRKATIAKTTKKADAAEGAAAGAKPAAGPAKTAAPAAKAAAPAAKKK